MSTFTDLSTQSSRIDWGSFRNTASITSIELRNVTYCNVEKMCSICPLQQLVALAIFCHFNWPSKHLQDVFRSSWRFRWSGRILRKVFPTRVGNLRLVVRGQVVCFASYPWNAMLKDKQQSGFIAADLLWNVHLVLAHDRLMINWGGHRTCPFEALVPDDRLHPTIVSLEVLARSRSQNGGNLRDLLPTPRRSCWAVRNTAHEN